MEEKKIQITELTTQRHAIQNDDLFQKYLKDVIQIKPYLPYVQKVGVARAVVYNSCMQKDENKKDVIKIDSIKRYLFYIFALLDNYTNIQVSGATLTEDYDQLESNNLIEPIINLIPEQERLRFETFVKMAYDDFIANEQSFSAIAQRTVTRVSDVAQALGGHLKPVLDKVDSEMIRAVLDEQK